MVYYCYSLFLHLLFISSSLSLLRIFTHMPFCFFPFCPLQNMYNEINPWFESFATARALPTQVHWHFWGGSLSHALIFSHSHTIMSLLPFALVIKVPAPMKKQWIVKGLCRFPAPAVRVAWYIKVMMNAPSLTESEREREREREREKEREGEREKEKEKERE